VWRWNGTAWTSDSVNYATISAPTSEEAPYTCDFEIPSADIDEPGVLRIEFLCGKYIIRGEYEQVESGHGMYMPICDLVLAPVWEVEAENKVTTIYNERNNVKLSRRPKIGCLNFDTVSPQEVKNGIYAPVVGRPAAREWRWTDDQDTTTYQLPVLLHKQLLAFHHKPNNVLTGSLVVNGLRSLPTFDSLWIWRGERHLLVAGRINLLNGQVEGAELREFVTYNALWGGPLDGALLDSQGKTLTDANDEILIIA
jgi:hypothetical protein